jgi:predicted DNA-binding transcriptional regulator YafY
MEQVLKALRSELMIECENHSPYFPSKNKDKRIFGPLMLNMVGGIPYVLMHDPNDAKNPVKNLRLSRLHQVTILDKKVQRAMLKHAKTMDLSFSGYGGTTEEIIDFEILCQKNMGQYFMEREINHTQKIKPEGDLYRLSFRSHASLDLIRLLAGFGDEIQSVKPQTQFKRLLEIWKKAPK